MTTPSRRRAERGDTDAGVGSTAGTWLGDRLSLVSVHSLGRPGLAGPRRLVREVGLALVTAGLVVLLFVVYELVGTNLSEEHSQAQLARDFNAAVAGARPAVTSTTTSPAATPAKQNPSRKKVPSGKRARPGTSTTRPRAQPSRHPVKKKSRDGAAPAGRLPVPPPGGALDHLVIPAIGVDRYVVEGVGEADLQMGPGHYPGTPLPGQAGNVGIAGHRTTFGAPFFRLNALVRGDFIYLTDISGTTWVYDVVHQWVVPPSDTAVLDATHQPELTLTTCNPRFEATSRLVVRAVLVKRLPRGARLAGHLPASVAPATAVPRTTAPLATVPRTTAPGTTASTLPASTTTSTTPPGTSATSLGHPTGKGKGGAGADSPTVAGGAGPASSSTTGPGVWAAALGWGALALVVWVASRVLAGRRRRYAKLGLLVCGGLVCLVPLWFSFAHVVDLLPANL